MKDLFENRLKKMARSEAGEVPKLPDDYDGYIENVLRGLPRRRKSHVTWKGGAVLVAALMALMSITVTAAVNYARQRMEAMEEKEKLDYYIVSQSPAPADFYSRELTGKEKERMKSLAEAYTGEGRFPEGELKRISDSSEYDGKGVAFLAPRSTYFLPEEEMSDEEILQIIDFMAKREFSVQEAAKKIEAGDGEDLINAGKPAPMEIDLKAQDRVIAYDGDMRPGFAAAGKDAIYFGETGHDLNGVPSRQSRLYRMENGSDTPVPMDIQAPEGMSFTRMTMDAEGNLCVVVCNSDDGKTVGGQLWKIKPDGSVEARIDLTKTVGDTPMDTLFFSSLAVDGEGRYFIAKRGPGEKQRIFVLDKDGSLLNTIVYNQKGDIRALGRGRDGRVYGVLMDGEDWTPTLVDFDVEKGKINKIQESVLPADTGAYTLVSAGTDSDLLIWGLGGVYSYNFGEEKAVRRLAAWELPDAGVLCITPDGRALLVTSEYTMNEDRTKMLEYHTDKIYLIGIK